MKKIFYISVRTCVAIGCLLAIILLMIWFANRPIAEDSGLAAVVLCAIAAVFAFIALCATWPKLFFSGPND